MPFRTDSVRVPLLIQVKTQNLVSDRTLLVSVPRVTDRLTYRGGRGSTYGVGKREYWGYRSKGYRKGIGI